MQGITGAALMLLQDDAGQLTHDVHLTMIFMGILAISVLVLMVGLLIAAIAAGALVGRAIKSAEQFEKHTGPMLDKINGLLIVTAELTPTLRSLTDNVEHISTVARSKVDEVSGTVSQINETVVQINKTVQEANGRTRAQVARVDGIVSDTVTAAQHISESVQHSINVPVRQVAGIVAGVKAGLETWIARSPFAGISGSSGDGVRYKSRPKQES